MHSGGIFDVAAKQERLEEVERELAEPGVWGTPEKAQALGKERASLEAVVGVLLPLRTALDDAEELLALAVEESDEETLQAVASDLAEQASALGQLEFRRMFSGPMDSADCFVDIQAGSGGTEAQDWAEMLLRMYLRWAERRGFSTELIELSAGEVAGIKGATFALRGDYAFGWLRTETGIHRLVRKSPYDSGARRHTSFASVFVSPEIDDDIDIDINPADVRTDTYRSSGAGGSTSTPPIQPYGSPTFPVALWWPVNRSGLSIKTAIRPGSSCGLSFMNWKFRSVGPMRSRLKTANRILAGGIRSAPTCWIKIE